MSVKQLLWYVSSRYTQRNATATERPVNIALTLWRFAAVLLVRLTHTRDHIFYDL